MSDSDVAYAKRWCKCTPHNCTHQTWYSLEYDIVASRQPNIFSPYPPPIYVIDRLLIYVVGKLMHVSLSWSALRSTPGTWPRRGTLWRVVRQMFTTASRVLVQSSLTQWSPVWVIIQGNGQNVLQREGSWKCALWGTTLENWRKLELVVMWESHTSTIYRVCIVGNDCYH